MIGVLRFERAQRCPHRWARCVGRRNFPRRRCLYLPNELGVQDRRAELVFDDAGDEQGFVRAQAVGGFLVDLGEEHGFGRQLCKSALRNYRKRGVLKFARGREPSFFGLSEIAL